MNKYLKQLFQTLRKDDNGNAATEYAIMIALILVFCLATLLSTGDFQKSLWSNTAAKVQMINP